ncbi:hypothetical protein [Streptomyces sp. NBC_00829]|uniref:hypothetical protein n=1 Tax=Streptomyces sp. NBC_00829 TaxID=2903679 RepID=UPI00386530E9|nr:hypothetical protein OG293_32860 [Streptomyces sp. NBC_00829]
MTGPKPGFRAELDQLRQEMGATGATPAAIAIEIRTRFRVRPREAWRHVYGWSLQQTANRINDLGIERPGEAVAADASLLGKWEKWPARSGRRPSPAVLRLLADLYDCGLDALLDLEDRRTMPPGDLRLLHTATEPTPDAGSQAATPAAHAAGQAAGPELVRTVAEESAAWA